MKKLLSLFKSPVILFIVLGVLLFWLYYVMSNHVALQKKTVTISAMQVEMQKELFAKTWNRQPSEPELQKQLDNIIMDEIFYKEGVALGIDKSDIGVKRRLRQVVELMLEDFSTVTPNENQLRTFLNEHPEKFRSDTKLSFEHLYFDLNQAEEAQQFLQKIKANENLALSHTGRLSMMPNNFDNTTLFEISRYLGTEFTKVLEAAETAIWFGPVESPYGYHLVKIDSKTPGEIPDLNEIWTDVEREWTSYRKQELKKEHYQNLREQYHVVYENQ